MAALFLKTCCQFSLPGCGTLLRGPESCRQNTVWLPVMHMLPRTPKSYMLPTKMILIREDNFSNGSVTAKSCPSAPYACSPACRPRDSPQTISPWVETEWAQGSSEHCCKGSIHGPGKRVAVQPLSSSWCPQRKGSMLSAQKSDLFVCLLLNVNIFIEFVLAPHTS